MRRACTNVVVSLLVGWVIACPSRAHAQDNDVIARILSEWKKRQDLIHSVQCSVSGKVFYPKGKWDQDFQFGTPDRQAILKRAGSIPRQDTWLPIRYDFLLDLDKNWARKDSQYQEMFLDKGQFAPKQTTHLYDGKVIRIYEPRDKNVSNRYTPSSHQPDLWIPSERFAGVFFSIEDHPLFWGCGIVQPSAIDVRQLKHSSSPSDFLLWGHGEIEGRDCVVLRTRPRPSPPGYHEYWVDLERGAAIVRCVYGDESSKDFQMDIHYRPEGQVWLPSAWRYTHYWTGNKQQVVDGAKELKVDRLTLNPAMDVSDFNVQLQPGMVVRDVKKHTHDVVASDAKTLVPLASPGDPLRTSYDPRLFLITAGLALACLMTVGYLWRKRVRSLVH